MTNFKKEMLERTERRHQSLIAQYERVKRYILRIEDNGGEPDRLWLDKFAKGEGLDICCGSFLIGEAKGVDGDWKDALAADYFLDGDELYIKQGSSLDFVVSNYIEAFPNPLKALNEWWRILRPGGTIALVCRDSDVSEDPMVPLKNPRRASCFTEKTIQFYLRRAGFDSIKIEKNEINKSLRMVAKKP